MSVNIRGMVWMGRYDEVMNPPKEDRTHFVIVQSDGLPPPTYEGLSYSVGEVRCRRYYQHVSEYASR